MKLPDALEIYGGGPGSGPNAPCPQCGPKGGSKKSSEKFPEDRAALLPSTFKLKPPNPSSVPQPPNTRQVLEMRHADLMSRYGANLTPHEQWELEHWNKVHPNAPMYPKDWTEYYGKPTTAAKTMESWPEADAQPRTSGGGTMKEPTGQSTLMKREEEELAREEEEEGRSRYDAWGRRIRGEEDEVVENPVRRPAHLSSDDLDDTEKTISSGKPLLYKRLGGGVSGSYIVNVTDTNGNKVKCVWKPDSEADGSRNNISFESAPASVRELACWNLAKVVGMDDLVNTHAVVRSYQGEEGSMCYYQPGTRADESYGNEYDGETDTFRAAAFDYITGNEDRHSGNWVITADGKYGLIDHNLTFPDHGPFYRINDYILKQAHRIKMRNTDESKEAGMEPKAFAEQYVKNRMAIRKTLKAAGLPDSAIEAVDKRITTLSKAKNWSQLVGDDGRDMS